MNIKSQNGSHVYTSVAASVLEPGGNPLRILFSFVLSAVRTSPVVKMRGGKKKDKKRWWTESEKCSGALLLSEPGREPSSDFTHGEVGKGIHLPRRAHV